MANHKSALKRIRQNEKRRVRNKGIRAKLRTQIGIFDKAVQNNELAIAEAAFVSATSALDRAATKGIIPRSRASRKTSRLAKQLNTLR